MTNYLLTVNTRDNADEFLAFSYGDFTTVNFVAKRTYREMADAKEGSEFEFRLTEVDAIGDSTTKRNIVSVTGDPDVVTYVAKKKIAVERKAQNGGEDEADETPAGE